MSKKIDLFLDSMKGNLFSKKFFVTMSNEEADEMIQNTNWDFIENVTDEFSQIVEDHGLDDAVEIYIDFYGSEYPRPNEFEKLSTGYSLMLMGHSMQDIMDNKSLVN